jgi:hypothetical protein
MTSDGSTNPSKLRWKSAGFGGLERQAVRSGDSRFPVTLLPCPANNHRSIGMEPFVGSIQIFAFGFAPVGWAPCNGQLLQIAQFAALYNLIGTTYGGDGQTTFALPKLAPLGPKGPVYCISLFGQVPKA